jgi:hypothetical protein
MHRNVRIVFLALALVLCTLAGMAPPATAVAYIGFCGNSTIYCHVDADCASYCQACNYPGWGCDTGRYGAFDPGYCLCITR